jgi:putative transposase
MARLPRIVLPGLPHHVTQRGNNRQDVFFVADDRQAYLALLKEQSARFGVTVLGYCLMSNHVHLVVVPSSAGALARAIGRTHYLYAQYVNRLHGRSGHLWQNRFFSCGLDERHLAQALRYVEQNPVRARLVRAPWTYRWSSAAAHCGEEDSSGVLDLRAWRKQYGPAEWKALLRDRLPAAEAMRLKHCANRGRPLGGDSFLSKLEAKLNRRLRPLPVGRPPMRKAETGKK